jgi:hypothetical protein
MSAQMAAPAGPEFLQGNCAHASNSEHSSKRQKQQQQQVNKNSTNSSRGAAAGAHQEYHFKSLRLLVMLDNGIDLLDCGNNGCM